MTFLFKKYRAGMNYYQPCPDKSKKYKTLNCTLDFELTGHFSQFQPVELEHDNV